MMDQKILDEMAEARRKAFDALGRYKFWMFGYHAAMWVNLNRLAGARQPNPFKDLVLLARKLQESNNEPTKSIPGQKL